MEKVKMHGQRVLSEAWGRLTQYQFDLHRRDGTWQRQVREVYDRGNGAVCLLHNPDTDAVLLTQQFRLPVFVNGGDADLIEAPAGLLDGAKPADRMRTELIEETGFAISDLTYLYDLYMSPGSVTEYLAFFTGTYRLSDQVAEGGGAVEEGEDIAVLHVPVREALEQISDGRIRDAKTVILLQHLALSRQ